MKLTEKESQIYQYILAYTQEHMYAPTIREIGKAVGYKSTSTVASYLERLESKGMIEVGQDSPRARYMREKYPESWARAVQDGAEKGGQG